MGVSNTKRQYRYNPGNMEGMDRRISNQKWNTKKGGRKEK